MKKTRLVTAIFALLMLSAPNVVDAGHTSVEVGPTFVSSEPSDSFLFALRHGVGDWSLVFGAMDDQTADVCPRPDCKIPVDSVLFVGADRAFSVTRRLTLEVGPYWINRKNRISSANLNARLALHYQITSRLGVRLSHFSNFGSGEDIPLTDSSGEVVSGPCRTVVTVSHTTCEREPVLNDSNLGYDSLLITWRF